MDSCDKCYKRIWFWQDWIMHGPAGQKKMYLYHKKCYGDPFKEKK